MHEQGGISHKAITAFIKGNLPTNYLVLTFNLTCLCILKHTRLWQADLRVIEKKKERILVIQYLS